MGSTEKSLYESIITVRAIEQRDQLSFLVGRAEDLQEKIWSHVYFEPHRRRRFEPL